MKHLPGGGRRFIITDMLESLQLTNFILVKDETIDFDNNFNVLTGETGAGKSLIIKSLSLLAGQQASEDLIREGASFSVIEATFKVPDHIKIEGFELENQRLIVSRRIQKGRPTTNKINFESVSMKVMKQVINKLIFMTTQHQVYELLNTSNHLTFFDKFIGEELTLAMAKYKIEYKKYQELLQIKDSFSGKSDALNHELNELNALVKDIDGQSFSISEENDLNLQQKRCEDLQEKSDNVAKILININESLNLLGNLDTLLNKYNDQSGSKSMFDPLQTMDQLQQLTQVVSQEKMEIEYLEAIDLDEVNERLNEIFKYKVKYRVNSLSELLELKEVSEQKIADIDLGAKKMSDIAAQLENQRKVTQVAADELSDLRQKNFEGFQYIVLNQIKQLGMVDARFELSFDSLDNFSGNGLDSVHFLFSANPNTSLRPLKDVASGGELSRVMLALLVSNNFVLSQPIVILDEIDVGIGGVTANYIGETLESLANSSQLLVITHLPQIARCAQHHYKIKKITGNDESYVTISKLGKDDVLNELQRMVGGELITSLLR